jgi:hypothetical protein
MSELSNAQLVAFEIGLVIQKRGRQQTFATYRLPHHRLSSSPFWSNDGGTAFYSMTLSARARILEGIK